MMFKSQVRKLPELLLVIALLGSSQGRSQDLASPQLSVTTGFGVAFPTSYSRFPDHSPGIAITAKGRLSFQDVPVIPTAIVSYTTFSSEGPGSEESGYPWSTHSLSFRNLILGLGLQSHFFPLADVRPYIGAIATVNILNAHYAITTTYDGNQDWWLDTATRYGIILTSGATIDMPNSPLAIEVEAAYSWLNLLGRSFSATRDPSIAYLNRNLNDANNPENTRDQGRSIESLTVQFALRYNFY
jgi:hypothetical protein